MVIILYVLLWMKREGKIKQGVVCAMNRKLRLVLSLSHKSWDGGGGLAYHKSKLMRFTAYLEVWVLFDEWRFTA